MTEEITITGNGSFKGARSNIGSYSVTLETMPTAISDSTGGVGELSFEAVATDDTRYLFRNGATLSGIGESMVEGVITSVHERDGFVSISALPPLSALVAEHPLPPFVGTLEGAFQAYLDIVNFEGDLAYGGPTVPVVLPGGLENVWGRIKDLCALYRLEFFATNDFVMAMPKQMIEIPSLQKAGSISWETTDAEIARTVEISYYNSEYLEWGLLYPAGGWSTDAQVFQVAAGEITEAEIQTDASIFEFEQPVPVTFVPRDYTGTASVYAISGNDGLPVPPQLWLDSGGDVSLELGDDYSTLHLTVTGPRGDWAEEHGPFVVALSSDTGAGNSYSSLRIMGRGITFSERVVVVPTGVEDEATARDVGITVTSKVVTTLEDALNLAPDVAHSFSGAQTRLAVSAAPTLMPETLQYQVSWLNHRGGIYRVRSANITPGAVEISAEPATRIIDIEDSWGSLTYGELEDSDVGLSYTDFGLAPLNLPTQVANA